MRGRCALYNGRRWIKRPVCTHTSNKRLCATYFVVDVTIKSASVFESSKHGVLWFDYLVVMYDIPVFDLKIFTTYNEVPTLTVRHSSIFHHTPPLLDCVINSFTSVSWLFYRHGSLKEFLIDRGLLGPTRFSKN